VVASVVIGIPLSEPQPNPLSDGYTLINFQSGGLRDIRSELGAKFCHVVGDERDLVAGARDRNIAEAGVEQVRMDAGSDVNENAFSGEALGAVTGDGRLAIGKRITKLRCR